MHAILKHALQLACLIRDSEEAKGWRKAWSSLADIEFTSSAPMARPVEEIPIVDHVLGLRRSDPIQARPLLFPLLVHYFLRHLDAARIKNELGQHPQVWNAYQHLISCLTLTGQLITFLRSIGPGYPHENLVYTLTNTPWTDLGSAKELPWDLGRSLIRSSTDARYIGLDRSIPSVSQQIAASLNALIATIEANDAWLQLEKSYNVVAQRKNLVQEIYRARVQFEKELDKVSKMGIPPSVWRAKAEELAQKVYSKRGSRIQAYVESFLEYERLIECIYWLTSQLVMYESISCLTSSAPHQLQQVSLSGGRDALLTALTQARARTLQVGQLVHIELVETDHLFDGLYQVEQWYERYRVAAGTHALFRSRCLWHCQLRALLDASEEFVNRPFVSSETDDIRGEGGWIDITGPDGKVTTLPIRDAIPSLELHTTMYFP